LLKISKMELPITTRFIILALDPEKGRIRIDNLYFRYSLCGSVLMDFFANGEIRLNEKKVIPAFRRNGVQWHDICAERIEKARNNKTIAYWVRNLVRKSRFVFSENIRQLVNLGIVRHEKRYFLNIIPYNRYFISNPSVREELIMKIRGILLDGKTAEKDLKMLIGLIRASRSFRLIADDRSERRLIKNRCKELTSADSLTNETDTIIRQVQMAVMSSVMAAAASRGLS
jgi:hypothetical protein